MKRFVSCLLVLTMLMGFLVSCGNESLVPTEPEEKTEEKKTVVQKTEESVKTEKTEETKETKEEIVTLPAVPQEPAEVDHMLDGKKIIFVGNSYTYYGNAVLTKAATIRKQSQRVGDQGYFYQLCKDKGAEVNVTNWTYGSHGLGDLFDGCTITKNCSSGYDHKKDLEDAKYDYVFLQDRTAEEYTPDMLLSNVDKAVAFFRAANPDVKIFFLVQHRVYEWNVAWKSVLKNLPEKGVTVIEWGAMVQDIIEGKTAVPGAKETYEKNSFVIAQSKDDGYHPNMLSGYITATMAYCAITGESAVGQPYAFCTDAARNSRFNVATFTASYYKYNNAKTNFRAIFASPEDMKGLQTLMDQYLAAHRYRTY